MTLTFEIVIRSTLAALCAGLLLGGDAHGTDARTGRFELPAGETTSWHVDFDVPYPGTVAVVADWSSPRLVSLRIDGLPGSQISIRRAGPPPQRIELEVGPELTGPDRAWSVQIHALPAREAAEGRITVLTPERAKDEADRTAAADALPITAPATRWRKPYDIPEDASEREVAWILALERFRNVVVDDDATDSYRWQDGMLRHLASIRDDRAAGKARPENTTRRMLEEIAAAIRAVDELRVSEDPLIVGPVPVDRDRRRAWQALRSERIGPVENSLNDLLTRLQRGHAPELEREKWSIRLVSALSACERYYDDLVTVGAPYAAGADVAEAQWMRLLAAAEVFERLSATTAAEDPAPLDHPISR